MPPNSLRDPNVGFKVKQWKKKGVKANSLHSTCGVGGCARTLGWD